MSLLIIEPADVEQTDQACAELLKEVMMDSLRFLDPTAQQRILKLTKFEARDRERLICQTPGGPLYGFVDWRSGWVTHLFVSPNAQKQGIGRALFDAAQTRIGGTVHLLSFQQNERALAFYLRIGCVVVGERDGMFFGSRESNFIIERPFGSFTPNLI